jgi:hypothetical protein
MIERLITFVGPARDKIEGSISESPALRVLRTQAICVLKEGPTRGEFLSLAKEVYDD